MDLLLVLGGILWVVLSVMNKKKQQEKKQAERESAAMGRAAQAQSPAPAPVATTRPAQAAAPRVRPFNPYAPEPESAPDQKAQASPARQQAKPTPVRTAPLVSDMRPQTVEGPLERTKVSLTSNLTQIQSTKQHQLTSSYDTGHAHQETSMQGFEANCPPSLGNEPVGFSRPQVASPAAFSWNQNAVLSGLIYSEILGKPKALRGR